MSEAPAASGPPSETTGSPPAPDPTPDLTTTWEKRAIHGAKVTLPTAEKIRNFFIRIIIKNDTNDHDASSPSLPVVNAYKTHREFFIKFFELAGGDVHFLPTTDQERTDQPEPAPLVTNNAFPITDKLHRSFFHRTTWTDPNTRDVFIRIKHRVLMKATVSDMKDKLKPWLTERNILMTGGDLNATETCIIGWIPEQNAGLVWRPMHH
jgi:hypothetical protein